MKGIYGICIVILGLWMIMVSGSSAEVVFGYPDVVVVNAATDTSPSYWSEDCQTWYTCTSLGCTDTPCGEIGQVAEKPELGSVQRHPFEAGSYEIMVAEGDHIPCAAGIWNETLWHWFLQIYIEGALVNEGYALGSYNLVLSPEKALEPYVDESVIVTIDNLDGGYVWFWYFDAKTSNNSGYLTVTVQKSATSATGATDDLIEYIEGLEEIPRQIKNSLKAPLKGVVDALERGDHEAAVGKLGAFKNKVRAAMRKPKQPLGEEAANLIAQADAIIALIAPDLDLAPPRERVLHPGRKLTTLWGKIKAE